MRHPRIRPPAAAGRAGRRDRWRLILAAAAILLAAADTYVVVVALPSIMSGVGVSLDRLQRATPIISGFLLGYTAVLPLIGRLADLAGTDRVFNWCLGAFAAGSVVTATAHSLPVVVAGRALQGVGGGGLVPVTLAMVAARWPEDRRGTPLGAVGAVQELGSVIGPLYGAVIVAVASWRAIFWINVPAAAVLALAFHLAGRADPARGATATRPAPTTVGSRPGPRPAPERGSTGREHRRVATVAGWAGPVLMITGAAGLALALDSPPRLTSSASVGQWFAPQAGGAWSAFTTPAALASSALVTAGAVWSFWWRARREAAGPPDRPDRMDTSQPGEGIVRAVDLPGAALLAGFLGCVVVLFSTADPSRHVVASSASTLVPLALALAAAFVWRQRTARHPLVPPGSMQARPAWGALVVNLFVGAALMAALVDVPLFARATKYPDSAVGAALILLRFLVAVPVGALAGGALCRRRALAAPVAASGMALSSLAFVVMTTWSATTLGAGARPGDAVLALAGLGFGLAIAPVNVAVLGAVESGVHALAGALAVVARTVGMLAGVSALTALALHRFYRAQARIGSPLTLCPDHPTSCPVYDRATTHALLAELHTIFAGAAICAGAAAVLALLLLRPVGSAGRPEPG